MSQIDIINVYYDHYKETNSIQKKYLIKRDHLTFCLIVTISLLSFFLIDPDRGYEIVSQLIDNQLKVQSVSFEIINTLSIALFLFLSLRYYQVCLTIERNYTYLHNVENILSEMTELNIDRESGNYLSFYPWLFNVIHFFFTYLFPLIIIGISVLKIYMIFQSELRVVSFVNVVFLVTIVVITIVYIIDRFRI